MPAGVKRSQPEPGHGHVVVPEDALVGEVVDGEEGGQRTEHGMVAVERAQVDGNQPGLPVVGVDDLRSPARSPSASIASSAAPTKEHEALAVVPVVAVRGAVEPIAVEVVVLGEEVDGDAAAALRLEALPRPRGRPEARGDGSRPASAAARAASTPRYLGMSMRTSCPRAASARGSAPTTSASPPVLAKGAASEAIRRMRRRSRAIVRLRPLRESGRPAR